jgi:hypothetical protein
MQASLQTTTVYENWSHTRLRKCCNMSKWLWTETLHVLQPQVEDKE